MGKEVKVWYDKEGDYLEVIFERKAGYFRETKNDAVMQKVDKQGNIIGFSIMKVSALKEQKPLSVTLDESIATVAASRQLGIGRETRRNGIWVNIVELTGQELNTLDQEKPFSIIKVSDKSLKIKTSTGNHRNISRNEIEGAWQHLTIHGQLSRSKVREQFSEFNPAYVVAIIAKLPKVTVTPNPIVLHYRGIS